MAKYSLIVLLLLTLDAYLLLKGSFVLADNYRPQYHVLPEKNWMNDPNGPVFYKGIYHLFFQYNPFGAVWGNMHWGHVISTDLAHWKHLPVALAPDMTYDQAGIFSGSITIVSGNPVILYTGQLPNNSETQCMAFPASPSSPFLETWTKYHNNPIISEPPKLGNPTEFRDPSTAWQVKGTWYIAVGTQYNGQAATMVYGSTDFNNWAFKNVLYSSNSSDSWECPDLMFVESSTSCGTTVILKVSTNPTIDVWTVGCYDQTTNQFSPLGDTVEVSYGRFYASKSFFDPSKNQYIQWGWVAEEDQAGPSRGWQGVQSLPVVVAIDDTFVVPTAVPIPELSLLRIGEPHRFTKVQVPGGAKPVTLEGVSTNQSEIVVLFNVEGGGTPPVGKFGVRVLDDGEHYTEILYNLDTSGNLLLLNRLNSGTTGNTFEQGGTIHLLSSELSLSLHIFLDHSIIEAFGHNGRARITSRVYVPFENALGVSLVSYLNSGVVISADVDVWELSPCWMDEK